MGLHATFFLIAGAIGSPKPFHHLLWDETSRGHCRIHPESRLPLNWDECREMVKYGMAIGSHGLTHRSIGYLGPETAKSEIILSKNILEDALSAEIEHFSYPFGSKTYGDFNRHTHRILANARYRSACSTEIGAVTGKDQLYALKRIPIRETDHPMFFRQKISGAYDWVQFVKPAFKKMLSELTRS